CACSVRCRSAICSAYPTRPPHELERSEPTEAAADRASDLLLPVVDHESPAESVPRCERDGRERSGSRRCERTREQQAEADPEPGGEPDAVPLPHRGKCSPGARYCDSSRRITASPNSAARAPSTTRWSKVTGT